MLIVDFNKIELLRSAFIFHNALSLKKPQLNIRSVRDAGPGPRKGQNTHHRLSNFKAMLPMLTVALGLNIIF